MKELPTSNEFFGAPQEATKELPSADEFFTSEQPSSFLLAKDAASSIITSKNPNADPAIGEFMKKTPAGRIMGAFGEGISSGGTGSLGIEAGSDIEKELIKHGVFNDYMKGEQEFSKSVTEAFARPAAVVLDSAWRGVNAVLGGIGAGLQQASEEVSKVLPELQPELAGTKGLLPELTEYALQHKAEMPMHTIPPEITRARSLAVIGEDEKAYFGLKEPTPEQAIARREATDSLPSETTIEQPKDIHAVARDIAPETFDKYDELAAQQEDLRGQLTEATEQRATDIQAKYSAEISELEAKVQEAKERGNKSIYEDILNKKIAERDAALETAEDSQAMKDIRTKMQHTDYAMRDIAPEVSAAYREAENKLPREVIPEEIIPEKVVEEIKPIEETNAAQQLETISKDVSQKLTEAGRPAEEADAAAQLVAQHYKAVADQGWAKGTPEEIYKRDSASIVAGKGGVAKGAKEFAQSEIMPKTETKKFKKWFGDSKVLDEQGKPLVVYHGTFSNFEGFDKSKLGSATKAESAKQGFFFAKDPAVASSYAQNPDFFSDAPFLNVINKITLGGLEKATIATGKLFRQDFTPKEGGNVLPVYLSMENPLEVDFHNDVYREKSYNDILTKARSEGHDGVIFKNTFDSGFIDEGHIPTDIYTVFEPKQIKSTFNKGEFDATKPQILEQKARGKIRLATDDAKAAITLFKNADASTFIHETGHAWLDEMMRYAKATDAPEGLLKDKATVDKWLGVKEGAEITRAQHEKFARGFERYLMEGTAPSKELATVFAKFKQWLTDIYQTVQKLRSPITDDIRHVFDRLLSANPERTVVAAERADTDVIHNMHEKLADRTPPEQATAAADNVRATIDRLAKQEPEVYNELKAAESREAAPISTGEAAGTPRGAQETAETVTGKPSEIGEGGGGVAPQSIEPQSNNPNAVLGIPESKFVDKAGNIRLDNLNTPEDINQVIRDIANENDSFMQSTRGVISDGQVLDLADALGMDASTLDKRKLGEAFNAEQIVAARKLLIQSAENVRDFGKKTIGGTEVDLMAYAEARARHIMVQGHVAAITAEAGRALRAFRSLEGGAEAKAIGEFLKENTGLDLFQLQEEAKRLAELDSPSKVSQLLQDTKKPSYVDKALEYWINALLSNPVTHAKNLIGNSLIAVNSVVETAIASQIGRALKSEDAIQMGEAKARFFGIKQGAVDGLIAAGKILKDENAIYGAHTVEHANKRMIGGMAGKVIRIPTRFLSAEDEIFKAIGYRQELNTIAYRTATKEGLTGDSFNQRMVDILQKPTEAMMEQAVKAAEYQTFTNSLGPTGRAAQALSNSHPLLKFVMPFIRTPTNILKYAGERTPLGLLSKEIRDNLSGANGTAARDTQWARLALGTTVATAAAWHVMQGNITGSGPSNQGEKATLRLTGWQPYSLKVGNAYYSYDWLEPFSTIIGTSADIAEAYRHETANDEDFNKILGSTIASISKNLLSKLSLRGVSDLIQVVSDQDRYGGKYVQNFIGSFVPAVSGQLARMDDPALRQVRTITDSIKSRIPGMKGTLFPKRDVWGNPIVIDDNLGPDIISPLRQSSLNTDPVNQRLLSVKFFPSQLDRKIRGVQLTDQQYDDYSRIAGRMAKMRLDSYVRIPGSANLPSGVQVEAMKSIVDHARETARRIVMMNNPDIIKQAINNKVSVLKKP